jgi:hypothetical protein
VELSSVIEPSPEPSVSSPSQVFVDQQLSPVPADASQTAANENGSPAHNEEHQGNELELSRSMVDIPTFLIQHWFKTVCPTWSAYDSHANPYRVLTSSLWTHSMPVYYALQAISAASLVVRLPHVMSESAMTAPRMAAQAIKKELINFSAGLCPRFPKELLLSLFCMSSSLCWIEKSQLGLQFVRQARAVLKCLDTRNLDAEEQGLLDFFNGCLIYEEMLRSVVSNDEIDFQNMLSWPEPQTSHTSIVLATPHAWTGVSSEVLRLFGKSMTLCRRSRSRFRLNNGTTYRVLQGALMDITEARLLEEALLAVDISSREESNELDDLAVNSQHLHNATEAYRLSSLLQLYQTFPDLIATRIPSQVKPDGSVAWSAWVTPLALHITSLLESIPPSSMSCIQTLICICAGTGLRFESRGTNDFGDDIDLTLDSPNHNPFSPEFDLLALGSGISESSLKISRARHFIMDRLRWLELSLPPKPIGVAKDLLKTTWTVYDEEVDSTNRTHWIDVMTLNGLQSLFG